MPQDKPMQSDIKAQAGIVRNFTNDRQHGRTTNFNEDTANPGDKRRARDFRDAFRKEVTPSRCHRR
jgi:hypothetical protein